MKATEILSQEHQVILQVLDCLERIIEEATSTGTLEAQPARDAIEFFQMFADKCHHGKEEAHLFTAMEAKGFPRTSGPTGVMLMEHESGRAFVRGMNEAVEAAAQGDRAAVQRFAQSGRNYVDLLRRHIEKEDHCLFGMANQVFSEQDQHDLLTAFEKAEAEHTAAGTHEKYLAVAGALAQRYGTATQCAPDACHGCSCGH
ncbi:MAG: hemerythrin domain-containing protein [Verrucomicrobia bacterium]|nr:hemerythrin domain-containing protein [Verrucomicrobiota bacterium]